jgi:ubiquinone/menaquinone biosynthesis C-methylase UbiE
MSRFQNTRQPDWEWWEELWSNPTDMLQSCGISPGQSVADIGSGNGYFTLPAGKLVDDTPVYAIDVDKELLVELSTTAQTQGLTNINAIHADARNLTDVLPEPVDVVLIANTFHGVEDKVGFTKQVYQSLRPNGRFIIVNWRNLPKEETTVAGTARGPPKELRMSAIETREIIAEIFDDIQEVDLPPYHYALIGER